ncbi:type IV pilus twitching motility protein PilT [Massilia oculi]|uniref:Twitching motility protein PilT n=1 Tax=Massilia oculi TaxID=945844 RepID=A0A2S2DDV8_9BURK|nr:ATPase, T2SS/T4P/T4SS family [Massilia oculi]AWL03524.1 twitching motility protein PilT [Massilia oculi]
MINPLSEARDLMLEIHALANLGQQCSDIHIEQDEPMMLKLPRGWQAATSVPVRLGEMRALLDTIDEDWEDKIVERAIDRLITLGDCRLRCNVFRAGRGRKVCISMRCLPVNPLPLDQTGLPSYVRTMLEATRGIILVTGPTGSGKTTTIAAMLDYLNSTRKSHIVTIEQPVEYEFGRKQGIISQKEVPVDTETFASGLLEGLRQKPDVLMVGEIRDQDTAETLLHAGESGHLVLASMHTNSAVSALTRLLAFFPAEQRERHAGALAGALVGVVCQGLVPSEDGRAFMLASEMLFNHNGQLAQFIGDPSKHHMIAEFMRRQDDNMSRSLNDVLATMVGKRQISARDAMRAAYNRMELHDLLNSQR